jgi:hypothetical protein
MDPLSWLNRCESYFRGTRSMLTEQVWLASLHMDEAAAECYYALERDYGMLPWARFAEFVNLRFGPPIRSNLLGELKELHRTGTVEDYQRQFLQLLSIKKSKCIFGATSVTYLGHVISANGVAMDPGKVEAVLAWPTPRTLHALRGFLGLTGYYRKFICQYGDVA